MKRYLAGLLTGTILVVVGALAAHAGDTQVITIDDTDTDIGTFSTKWATLVSSVTADPTRLSEVSDSGTYYPFDYAAIYFSPSTSGDFVFGQYSAPTDTVMILYNGIFDPNDPGLNAVTMNDDWFLTSDEAQDWLLDPEGALGHLDYLEPGTVVACGNNSWQYASPDYWCPQVTASLTFNNPVTLLVTTYGNTTLSNSNSSKPPLDLPLSFYTNANGAFATNIAELELLVWPDPPGITDTRLGSILTEENYLDGGTILLDGNLQYNLGISRNGGTLDTSVAPDGSSISVDLSDYSGDQGALIVTGGNSVSFSGNNTFSGGLTIEGGSTVSVSGASSLGTGGLTLNNGTLAATGALSIDQAVTIEQSTSNSIISTGNSQVTLSEGLSGSGSLTVTGGGTLSLSTANPYSGSLTVSGGTFLNVSSPAVIGSPSPCTNIVVENNSTIGGNGTICTTNVLVTGAIAPGNSPGTLTVAGDLTLDSGSNFVAEIDGRTYSASGGAGSYDRIVVTGNYASSGALTPILREISGSATNSFTPVYGDRFTIVTAGSVSGSFEQVNQPASGLGVNQRFDAIYNPNSIELVVTPVSFAALAEASGWARNAFVVGGALDAVRPAAASRSSNLQGLFDGLYGTTQAGYSVALQQLSGEIHADVLLAARDASADASKTALQVAGAMVGRKFCFEEAKSDCLEATRGPGLWGHTFYEEDRYTADDIASRSWNEQKGFALGINVTNTPETRIGVGMRYSDNQLGNAIGSSAGANQYNLFAYASQDFGSLILSGTAGWGGTDVRTSRQQTLTTGVSSANANYDVSAVHAALEAHYNLQLGNALIRPVLGLSYGRLEAKTKTEDSANANIELTLPQASPSTMTSKIGAEALLDIGPVSLVGNAAWNYEIDGSRTLLRPVALGSARWDVSTPHLNSSSFEFGGGIQWETGSHTNVTFQYAGERNGQRLRSDQVFLRVSRAF